MKIGMSFIYISHFRFSFVRLRARGGDQTKFYNQGKLSQSLDGGMMMLDGCAGLGEHGRRKDKSR